MGKDVWTKEEDGVWRTPRYPKGGRKEHPDVSVSYCEETNGALLYINDEYAKLDFNEMGSLIRQLYYVNAIAQAENVRLWEEKQAIMVKEDGYEPPRYGYKGRRIN